MSSPSAFVPARLLGLFFVTAALSACQMTPVETPPIGAGTTSATTSTTTTSASDTAASTQELAMDLSGRHEYQLENGLKVIIKEDHRAPIVMTQIWYKVGSTDEPIDKGGMSHLLEHMMFKGTPNVSSDDFERLIAQFGGTNNAFTSYDYTGYYELFPANYMPLALELEADRMVNLRLTADDFDKEHQVVMEERRQRTDDSPLAKAYESFRQQALPDSPKGESVIGPMDELASITLDDLQAWYDTWYAPNNATLVIVGDVDPEATLSEVKRYFGKLPKRSIPARPSVRQKGFNGYKTLTETQAVQVPVLMMGYNVPSLLTADKNNKKEAYALSFAQDVLDGGLSARLEQNLVRDKGLLTSVGTSYDLIDRGDGLFFIQATPREGVSVQEAEAAIRAEIDKLVTKPIGQDEITRAKTNTITGLVYAQDSMAGQARMIGSLQSIGLDDRILSRLPAELDKVSIQDIKDAAAKYLVKDNLTVMYVMPEDANNDASTSANIKANNTMPDATDNTATAVTANNK